MDSYDTCFKDKYAFTCKRSYIVRLMITIIMIVMSISMCLLAGCTTETTDTSDRQMVDYTVVEDEDLPTELKKLIDDRKENTVRLIFTTKDYTYIVAGYGTQETSGYSIRVNGVYVSDESLFADVSLIGPAQDEFVNEVTTTPYVVLKMEKREESVVFKM